MRIESAAFKDGAEIPRKHTCDGADVSPPLAFSGVPEGARSLALVCDDPDAPAGTWVHWVLFNLPPDCRFLPESVPKTQFILKNAAQGVNDFGRIGWGGPCPPPGKPHRYVFRLLALAEPMGLRPGASKGELLRSVEGRVLAEASLTGLYRRG